MADMDARSVIKARPAANRRKVREVPFVEMYGNRVQGVVSSGSDIERVYVSYFEAGTLNFN